MRRLLKILAGLLGLLFVLCLGCAGIYTWRVLPPSGSTAERPAAAEASAQRAFTVAGVIVDADGLPAEGVWVAGGQPRSFLRLAESTTRSAADGSFSLRMSEPGPVRVMGLIAEPGSAFVDGPVDDLFFSLAPRCALDVQVHVGEGEVPRLLPEPPELDAPLGGAMVQLASIQEDGARSWALPRTADAEGRVTVDPAPCGPVALRVGAEGHVSWLLDRVEPDGALHVALPPAALIDGQVTDEAGAPLSEASVYIVGADDLDITTDADGRYQAWVSPARVEQVAAWKEGYLREEQAVRLAPDSPGATLDFQLAEDVWVDVRCAGLPEDSCGSIEPIMCTRPMVMLGKQCNGGDVVRCRCPGAPAAVRGGGQVARVEPGQREVWLDFSGGGAVIGEVWLEGEPAASCRVEMVRAPEGLFEDIGRGMLVSRRVRCDEEGRFEARGLTPGTWRFDARQSGRTRITPELIVREGQTTDLGRIELGAGGTIRGLVLNGLTDDPIVGAPVMVALADDPILRMPINGDNTDHEGGFYVSGLPPGDYRVSVVYAPFASEEVRLLGEETVDVELWLGHDELPEEQGFTFVRGGAGELLISDLDPEGLAAEAGLVDEDVVVGASLFGFDLARAHPELFEQVLSRYSGPGLTLQVERGGEVVEIELE